MPNIGTLTVQLVAQATAFEKTMRQAQKTMETTAKTFERQARRMQSLGQDLMLGLTAPLALIGGAALKLAGDMEQTQIAFANMLGSAQAAQDFLDQLAKFAEKTPFEYTDLTQQARQLMAYGFAAQDIIPMLTAVGDAVAAMGGNAEMLNRVTRALGQMRAKQKVSAEEMRQLTEAGIPAWEYLAQTVGKSVPEVMKLSEKGLIPANVAINGLLQAMEKDFGGMMAQQAKTMLGSLSNLRDVLERLGRTMGGAINQTFGLTQKIQALTNWVGRAADALQRMNPILRSTIIYLGLAALLAGPLLYGLGLMYRASATAARGAALLANWASRASFAFGAWRGGAASLGEALAFLVGSRLRLMIGGIGGLIVVTLLVAKYWRQLAAVAQAVWSAIGAAVLYGASLVVRGVGLILAVIGVIIPPVRGAAQAVLSLADSLKAAAGQSLASAKSAVSMAQTAQQAAENQDGVAKAGENAAKSQEALGKATEDAAKAAQSNIQSFDEVHQIQESMAETAAAGAAGMEMPEIAMPAMPGVAGLGDVAAQLGQQVSQVADVAARAWERLRQAMEPVNRAVQWIKDNWPTIGPIVEGIAGLIMVALVPALIKAGVEATINGAKMLATWIAQGAAALVHGATVIGQLLLVGAKWAWLGIEATIHGAKVVAAWAAQGWQAIGSAAVQIGQLILVGAKWVWLGLQAGIGAAQVVAAWVAQRIQAVASVAVQVAQFIILGAKWVWMGITAMANAAVMAAAWFVALGPIGWVIAAIAAVAIAVALNWDTVKAKTIEIWEAVSSWLAEKWDWIKGAAETIWNWIKDNIIAPIQAAWDWLVATWNAIGTWLAGKWEWVKTTANTAWQGIKNFIQSPMQAVKDWMGPTWEGIAGGLANVWESIKTKAVDVWDGVKNVIKGAINGIIGIINKFIRAFNRIEIRVPRINIPFVGTVGGWSIRVPQIPEIPMLAAGGLVTGPTLAVLGERGPEAVVPLSRDNVLADSIAKAVYQAVVDGFRITQAGQTQQDREVVLRIDSTNFARLILPAIIKEGQRQGLNLVVRPAGVV